MQITFFSGKECHLCELAQQLLEQYPRYNELKLETVDVRQDHQTYHVYGARIPVLKRLDNGGELGWPFDAETLSEFLS